MDKSIRQVEEDGANTSYAMLDGRYSSKFKLMCQGSERDPRRLKSREGPTIQGHT